MSYNIKAPTHDLRRLVFGFRKKGITTLRIYQCGIFPYTVIETCFEMLKSTEHEKL